MKSLVAKMRITQIDDLWYINYSAVSSLGNHHGVE